MGKVLKALPFDAQQTIDPLTGKLGYDRTSNAKDLAAWMGEYFGNGVIVKGGNVLGTELEVTAATGLNTSVAIGEAVINGRTCWNELATEIAVDVGDTSDRIDRIVLSLDTTKEVRTIEIKVLKGTPNGAPVAPTLTRTTDIYQLSLAQVRVNASQALIESLTDERPDATLCGMSNVLIGIKPPTGMDAVTVQLSPETAILYGVSDADDAFKRAIVDYSSYQAFCANVNDNSLDAAFGKNNEDMMFGLGLQLAMYAWFKGNSKTTYPFTKLLKRGSFIDVLENTLASDELEANATLGSLITSNAYAANLKNTNLGLAKKHLSRLISVNPDEYTVDEFFASSTIIQAIFASASASLYITTSIAPLVARMASNSNFNLYLLNSTQLATLLASTKVTNAIKSDIGFFNLAYTESLVPAKRTIIESAFASANADLFTGTIVQEVGISNYRQTITYITNRKAFVIWGNTVTYTTTWTGNAFLSDPQVYTVSGTGDSKAHIRKFLDGTLTGYYNGNSAFVQTVSFISLTV